jgi:NAD(P)-dependent dehydrogenase (short-subunit alcohol dehydrogenase family)
MTDYDLPNFSTDLAGQVALVTGATSGLGRRFALVLAKAGADVVVTGRRTERLAEVAQEIVALGVRCQPLRIDMTDTANIRAVVEQAEQALGTVTLLVNNAGVPDSQRAHKMTDELIDSVFDTNLRGPYVLSCEVAKRLIEQKKAGRMVNISSAMAFHYQGQGAALYSTTKAGINRMTEALAVEWARFNINVNAISPGAFSSEMMDGMLERMGDITQNFPRKRLGNPAQLDSTLLYLMAPSSEFVTGTIVKVDDCQDPR